MAYAKKRPQKPTRHFKSSKRTFLLGHRAVPISSMVRRATFGNTIWELRKKLVPAGFEEFNYHTLEGRT